MKVSEMWISGLNFLGQAWWIEIITTEPNCIYYFGPFGNAKEANLATIGYVEDLEDEAAQVIQIQVKRCKPNILTIDEEYSN